MSLGEGKNMERDRIENSKHAVEVKRSVEPTANKRKQELGSERKKRLSRNHWKKHN